MISAKGYATHSKTDDLSPFEFLRRDVGLQDVAIEIMYCGVCHSDIHQARDEWDNAKYPMVPGHEIVGKVTAVGPEAEKFKIGDIAAVGCLVDSCKNCHSCASGLEQYCENGFVATYNSYEKDGKTLTYGGYSNTIVVDESFVLRVDANLNLAAVAPLLCAGITTYSPLKHWKTGIGKHVGVIGLGGLGHMAVKLAHKMGATVTLFTTSASKIEDAKQLGAGQVILSREPAEMESVSETLDLILNTVSARIDLDPYLDTLKREGTMVFLGIPDQSPELNLAKLIFKRRNIAGSLIGGIAETQEMLDFCSQHNIVADVEMINIDEINQAFNRMIKNDVKYRFVIDMASL